MRWIKKIYLKYTSGQELPHSLDRTPWLLSISWTVFVRLLFESGIYLLQPRQPLPRFNFCTRHARACATDSILGAASTREQQLFIPALLVGQRQFDSG